MSSQHKQNITDLLVKELRNELEERDMDTTGKKADLVERLKNALQEEGQDPETYLFEDKHAALISKVSGEISQISTDITSKDRIQGNEKKMEETEKVDKGMEPTLTDIKDDETKYKLEPRPIVEGSVSHAHVKVPNFDGKSSWNNYMKQFESAAIANGWSEKEKAVNLTIALRGDALDVLQTIAVKETDNFEQLKKRLNMRYGHEHLETSSDAEIVSK
uniref:Uncharacterized protein LOC114343257 n=1 Tax=Diabrotica virgifera virgifera TaxID=50390 RepID=A0A6P7GWT3_DIAVI